MRNKKHLINIFLITIYIVVLYLAFHFNINGSNLKVSLITGCNLLLLFYFSSISEQNIDNEFNFKISNYHTFKTLNNIFNTTIFRVFSGLCLLVFAGLLFSLSLTELTLLFAFIYLQMVLTFFTVIKLNTKNNIVFLKNIVLALFLLRIILERFVWEDIVTLNPFTFLVSLPAWISNYSTLFNVLASIFITWLALMGINTLINKLSMWRLNSHDSLNSSK